MQAETLSKYFVLALMEQLAYLLEPPCRFDAFVLMELIGWRRSDGCRSMANGRHHDAPLVIQVASPRASIRPEPRPLSWLVQTSCAVRVTGAGSVTCHRMLSVSARPWPPGDDDSLS